MRAIAGELGVEVSVRELDRTSSDRRDWHAVAVRTVLRYPHAALKEVALPVEPGEEARRIAADTLDTMRSFPGCVGLPPRNSASWCA